MRTRPRHSKVCKVWAEMVELEAAAGPDPRGHAPELEVVKDHPRTPNRTQTPIRPPTLLASRAPAAAVPASRCPSVLRAPPPGLRASAVAPPRPLGEPRPQSLAPPPAARGLDGSGEMGPRRRNHTWAAGVCAGAPGGPSPCPRGSPPESPPLSPAAAGGREGAGLPGPSFERAQRAGAAAAAAEGDHPSPSGPKAGSGPAQAWYMVA